MTALRRPQPPPRRLRVPVSDLTPRKHFKSVTYVSVTYGVCQDLGLVSHCSPLRKQSKPAAAPESPDIAKLAEVVEGLTQQVRQLSLILDEVREDLVWAVRNDKFHCAGHSQQYVARYTAPPPEAEDDEEEETNPPPNPPAKPGTPSKQTLFD